MRSIVLLLSVLLVSGPMSALERAGPEAWLQACGIDGLIYRHTELGYAATRVDWSFMSIDGDYNAALSAQCGQEPASALRLIAETYPQLERELARGEGLYTRSLLQQLGCDAEQSEQTLHDARLRLPAELARRPANAAGRGDLTLWYLELLADGTGWPCRG